jgi:hypothetical protein
MHDTGNVGSGSENLSMDRKLNVTWQLTFDNIPFQVNANQRIWRDFIQAHSRRFHPKGLRACLSMRYMTVDCIVLAVGCQYATSVSQLTTQL